jgi:hypothetical protein
LIDKRPSVGRQKGEVVPSRSSKVGRAQENSVHPDTSFAYINSANQYQVVIDGKRTTLLAVADTDVDSSVALTQISPSSPIVWVVG